jgi:hypothetical protein
MFFLLSVIFHAVTVKHKQVKGANMSKYVRVSQILARLQSYADVDPIVLEEKAKIGTNVHKAIMQDCANEFVVFESDRARAYFESYIMWRGHQLDIRQVPRLYCDKLMITGECDGLLNNMQIIDWKCSASANLKIWNMQAHFYWYLLKENGYDPYDKMLWINLRHTNRSKKDPETREWYRTYHALNPIVHEFTFDENVLSECIDEVNRYWEEYNNTKCLSESV